LFLAGTPARCYTFPKITAGVGSDEVWMDGCSENATVFEMAGVWDRGRNSIQTVQTPNREKEMVSIKESTLG